MSLKAVVCVENKGDSYMEYRLAGIDDIEDVFYLVKAAIVQMETNGIHQWDDIYPTKEDFITDIMNKSLYIADDNGKMAAIYVISNESDDAYNTVNWQYSNESA